MNKADKAQRDMTSTIIHPLFEECKNYTLDQFWKDKFSSFARNRFPSGVRFDPVHKSLILKTDGKTERVALPEDNPEDCFQIVMKILKEKLNMHSNRDIKSRKEEMHTESQKNVCSLEDCEWKKIKPRHLKDQLMMDYIARLKEKYNLSPAEVKYLISVVQLGFQFKALTQDDVEFSEGIIQNITGLNFDEKTRKFTIPDYPPCPKATEKVPNTDKFYSKLKKFLRDDAARINRFRN